MTKTKDELAAELSEGTARSTAEAEVAKADETVPGGDFIVDGKHVDCDGKEIKKGSKSSVSAPEDLESLTVADLKDRARDAEVSGFSTMNKDELIAAVKKAEK
jgi:hypothetical protein